MSDRIDAIKFAKRILEQSAHPDSDQAHPSEHIIKLSTEFLKAIKTIDQMHKTLQAVDWEGQATLDLINANRDEILKKHEEAITLIRKWRIYPDKIEVILNALNMFHPMHTESWCGWPAIDKRD